MLHPKWFNHIVLVVSCIATQSFLLYGQSKVAYPQNYFVAPMQGPLLLSGNFCELRTNHFHSGLDIRTDGREGKVVVASAEGYVSRIRVSPIGYGKAIYITHPNGYVTVYAHLSKFAEVLEKYVKAEQYDRESFDVDLYPPAGRFSFQRNELIGFSGNSGGSGGPHLHFEIREQATEYAVNPLLFGIPVADNAKPVIQALKIIPLSDTTLIDGKPAARIIPVKQVRGEFVASVSTPVKIKGVFGVAVRTYDSEDGYGNNQVYQIKVFQDDSLRWLTSFDRFSFDFTRNVNAYIDYPAKLNQDIYFQRCYRLPCNLISLYPQPNLHGRLVLQQNKGSFFKVKVSDIGGRTVSVSFNVVPQVERNSLSLSNNAVIQYTPCSSGSFYQTQGLQFEVPAYTLFDAVKLDVKVSDRKTPGVGRLYQLHKRDVPLANSIKVLMKPERVPVKYHSKVVLKDGVGKYYPTLLIEGELCADLKQLGVYQIELDTVAPVIKPLNIRPGWDMSDRKSIDFKVTDLLSGINSIKGFIDGRWVLMEYDAKFDLVTHLFDDSFKSCTNHTLKLIVRDNQGNENDITLDFIR